MAESTPIRWGTFVFSLDDKEYHVAPCTEEGELMEGHILSQKCQCCPAWQYLERAKRGIWVHEIIQ